MNSSGILGFRTISGTARMECGSLLERTLNGSKPQIMAKGDTRSFLKDSDTVPITGQTQVYQITVSVLDRAPNEF